MPGYLFHFCAEWQKARKVLQLDSETLFDVASCIVEDNGNLCTDAIVVQQLGLAGWRLDVPAATEAGILTQKLASDELGGSNGGYNGYTIGPNLITRNPTMKDLMRSTSGLPPGSPRSPRGEAGSPTKAQPLLGFTRSQNLTTKSLAPGFSKSVTEPLYSNSNNAPPVLREMVLFRNPAHPLSGLPPALTREEFVHEVRRRLVAEQLFPSVRHHQDNHREPMMSLEDAEDLFEALMLLQGRPDGTSVPLLVGRQLDAACDKFFALFRLRQLMERGASSMSAFFNMLDLGGRKGLEPSELKRFLKTVGGDVLSSMAAALAAEGVDVNRLAETLFNALDATKDGKVELWEMKRQLSLAAPPRMSMVELVGHFEMKNGYGKSALGDPKNRAQIFDLLSRKESLDFSPEDVARVFRNMVEGDRQRVVNMTDFDHFLKGLPIEVSWGVEPHAANQLYCAIGARTLQLARMAQMDACLPAEALLLSVDDTLDPSQEEANMRACFDRLWDRTMSYGPAIAGSAGKHLRDGCLRRFVEASHALKQRYQQAMPSQPPVDRQKTGSPVERQKTGSLPALRQSARSGVSLPRSLFPNISDVLVTASTQLHVGQACVVRYRLTGSCNFWGPNHEVLMNDRDVIQWPCPRKLLGETPFIGIVPCGLKWSSGGGGGFYAGVEAFTKVDPNLIVHLPRDPIAGHSLLFGTVEIIPPSLVRTARTGFDGLSQDFELRLFCATKSKIIGCIGEPLPVTVIHQVRPPPVATLQVRVEGRSAVLRWSALDLGPHGRRTGVEAVRIHMKSAHVERSFSLEADILEWEVQDLTPDTEYDFRIRLENRAGPGMEAVATVRTNANCATPLLLNCAVSNTSWVELRWSIPKTIGNETTKDRYQQCKECIERYEASLRVEDDEKEEVRRAEVGEDDLMDMELTETLSAAAPTSGARKCQWQKGSWREVQGGEILGKLNGLRPDTRYALEGFCGVNSLGKGGICRTLIFWTVPQCPRIASVRVKNGQVLVALSQTGGVCVKEFNIVASVTDKPSDKASFELPVSNLREDFDGAGLHPELVLPFEKMPPTASVKTHSFTLRARNQGGWSDWSESFEAIAVSKQQGAEQAQRELIQAMRERRIDALTRLLAEVKDIEFADHTHVNKATEMLKQLLAARTELNKTVQARHPGPLAEALKVARKVQLPDIEKAEALLKKLETVVLRLATAKGIDSLQLALKAAHEARLPAPLLNAPVEKLGTREAAHQGLLEAMDAARVHTLVAALETAVGMHLPLEEDGLKLLTALQHSESLLNQAVEKALIVDLVAALKSADESGLREDELLEQSRSLLAELLEKQEFHRSRIEHSMHARHPGELKAKLDAAQDAQVLDKDMQAAKALLQHLEGLITRCEDAVGTDERKASLDAAYAAEVPGSLLAKFEDQLAKLKAVHAALKRGSVEVLRICLRDAEIVGVKLAESAQAKVIYGDWSRVSHELEVALSLIGSDRLQKAIMAALDIGIAQDQLDEACATRKAHKKRDQARLRLEQALISRRCEALLEALKAACDAEVHQTEMLQEAHFLLNWLTKMRLELAAAVDTKDLKRVFDAYGEASSYPGLPHQELVAAKSLLESLQNKELDEISGELHGAQSAKKWRLLDYLATRANRVAKTGVEVDEDDIEEAENVAKEESEVQRADIENGIMDQRLKRDCARWEHAVPESGESTELPTGMVTGDLTVYFNPGGTYLATLPREIVEGKLLVPLEEAEDETCDFEKTNVIVNHLLTGLRKLLSAEDDILRINKRIFDDDSRRRRRGSVIIDGRLEISFSVYVRAAHSGVAIAEALVERGHLGGDLWESDGSTFLVEPPAEASHSSGGGRLGGRPGRPLVRENPAEVAQDVASTLTRSLAERTNNSSWAPGPKRVRRLCDFITNIRPRVLRRVSVNLGWYYQRGLMDSLDATCLVFDQDRLVEIVDHRGLHGFRYGTGSGSGATSPRQSSGADATGGAVRYAGDFMDDEHRTGKQVMQVRLDLMPERITDLVFVLSAYNSRDLSKFTDLNAVIMDMDGGAELASAKIATAGAEAIIMCSLYRLSDGLWRANSLMNPCKGTARDYRPVLARLLEIGYPRNVSMRDQVAPLFTGMWDQLSLDRAVKAAGVNMGPENTMKVPYAIELFSNSLRGPDLVTDISGERFHQEVLDALNKSPGGERFSRQHVVVHPPSTKDFRDARLEMQWNYPTGAKNLAMVETVPPQDENFLDATCIVFEGQALREIIDYRGAHGVRIVHNGVVDYGGVWVGKVGIGDATGGAVWHAGEEMDNASRIGKQFMEVRLDLLPRAATDLFFALSAPTNREITRYTDVQGRLIDSVNPGHEISSVRWTPKPGELEASKKDKMVIQAKESFTLKKDEPWESVILCSLSRAPNGDPGWHLVSFGCLTQGNATDYRPMILMLRAIQANRTPKPPPWPHQVKLLDEEKTERVARDKTALMLPHLPPAVVLRRSASDGSSDCSSSEHDSLADAFDSAFDLMVSTASADSKGKSSVEVAGGMAKRASLAFSFLKRRTSSLKGSASAEMIAPLGKRPSQLPKRSSAGDALPLTIREGKKLKGTKEVLEEKADDDDDDDDSETSDGKYKSDSNCSRDSNRRATT